MVIIRYGLIFRLVRLEGAAAYGSGHLAVHGGEDRGGGIPVSVLKEGGEGILGAAIAGPLADPSLIDWDEVEPERHNPPEESLGDLAVGEDNHIVASILLHVLVTDGAGELLPEKDIAEGVDLSLSD
tara:strand:- start:681 stop:1061 length:381 start_codon:yes stop_codon:yes gene_type:complete